MSFVASASTPNPGATITRFQFNFGDGSPSIVVAPTVFASSANATVSHTYSTTGSYPVSVEALDSISASGTATTGVTVTASGSSSQGLLVGVAAGWNMVGGPAGTVLSGNEGPLYTFQSGDVFYQSIPSGSQLQPGLGYWAYFTAAMNVTIPFAGPQSVRVALPPDQWAMVGNPGNTTATISGADEVVTFDQSTNGYVPTTQLQPGQAAWAVAVAGGTATITPAP